MPAFSRLEGDLSLLITLPELSKIQSAMGYHPYILREQGIVKLKEAQLNLEKKASKRDFSLQGGVKRYDNSNEKAFQLAISFPLFINNRNKGNIKAAQNEAMGVREKVKSAHLELKTQLINSFKKLKFFSTKLKILKNEMLPAAEQALAASRIGYTQGKFDFLTVLDAQRTFIKFKESYLDGLLSYHQEMAMFEFLTTASEAKNE
ncbi:TolC family protein [Candidatus Riflebacteria bacterium]